MSSLNGKGSTHRWRKIRQIVLDRDGACQQCGSVEDLQVDHIVPRRLQGTDELSNLQVLCKRCNLAKGGGFFDGPRTPPRLPDVFLPEKTHIGLKKASTASLSHYQD